jgi:hypothetical protein
MTMINPLVIPCSTCTVLPTRSCARARARDTQWIYTRAESPWFVVRQQMFPSRHWTEFHSRALTATITRENEIILLPRAATRAINVNLDVRLIGRIRSFRYYLALHLAIVIRSCCSSVSVLRSITRSVVVSQWFPAVLTAQYPRTFVSRISEAFLENISAI